MTEEEVSVALFLAATMDDRTEVLSWQSVDGKNYFAFDVKLRLPTNERVEPDLVLRSGVLWLIEVKGTHSEALADEVKLVGVLAQLGEDEIRSQIYRRAGVMDDDGRRVQVAVAFGQNDVESTSRCEVSVCHIEWLSSEALVERDGLGSFLDGLTPDGTRERGLD